MLLLAAVALEASQTGETRESVHGVHDEIAGLELEERLDRANSMRRRRSRRSSTAEHSDELAVIHDDEADRRQSESLRDGSDPRFDARDSARLGQDLPEAVLLGCVPAGHDDPRTVERGLPERARSVADPDRERLDGARAEIDLGGQALQLDLGMSRRELDVTREGARVLRRADAQSFRAVFDAQRLDADDHRALREQRRGEHALAVLDPARIRGHADFDARERFDAALVEWIERAQGFDLLPEHLDPQRQIGSEREEIEDLPAQADLSGLLRERRARVAGRDEPLQKVFGIQPLVQLEMEVVALEVGRRGHGLEEREDRRDDDARTALRGSSESLRRAQPESQRVGVGASGPGRRLFARGNPLCDRSERGEILGEGLALRVGRRRREPGSFEAPCELRENERLRRAPQVAGAHTSPRLEQVDQAIELGERLRSARG